MPLKSGALTPQERKFVSHMVRGNDATAAAAFAGYAQPSSHGGTLMRRPVIITEVRKAVAQRLRTAGAGVGVGMLIEIANDDEAPKNTRVMAAAHLAKLSGIGAGEREAEEKPLLEMPRAELSKARERAIAYLAELGAPVIEGEEITDPPTGDLFA
ncbi:hypothetical protein [Methylobacterium sp. J-077]|uniref:hypothetical protein n=1 Tax=Methylobacterium sp. J-077 TaxID=2836656 RepID=UPI001FB927BC|nr:hypothetical protein [Methylobacterium sp. J-077]MCJ2125902.1 hypothetical protein [Methylobacterium sp. J-077]